MGDYRAPLFFAWQLTNRCDGRCLHCCEESGPDRAWPDELGPPSVRAILEAIAQAGIPYLALGGGEPMMHSEFWTICEFANEHSIELKIETNGHRIDSDAAKRFAALGVKSVQVSLDGATEAGHLRVRPDTQFDRAASAVRHLADAGLEPEVVFVPTRLNVAEAGAVADRAASLGAKLFITGPMMRLGRAALGWDALVPTAEQERRFAEDLDAARVRHAGAMRLVVYPWDIVAELRARIESPQAMLLVVPNGKVKLLNALPFVCADLRRHNLGEAWERYGRAWRSREVCDFVGRAIEDPTLLARANECVEVELGS